MIAITRTFYMSNISDRLFKRVNFTFGKRMSRLDSIVQGSRKNSRENAQFENKIKIMNDRNSNNSRTRYLIVINGSSRFLYQLQ